MPWGGKLCWKMFGPSVSPRDKTRHATVPWVYKLRDLLVLRLNKDPNTKGSQDVNVMLPE